MMLSEIKVGEHAVITAIGGEGELRQHLLDMGLIPGAEIEVIKYAPMGDPIEIRIHGYLLTLRRREAEQIDVEKVVSSNSTTRHADVDYNRAYIASLHEHNAHPGLGESGRYHDSSHERPLPKGVTLRFALVGQQNCGKTTLFNQLTGSKQHVGNFPGVTVDRKDGVIRGHADTIVTDLPGIYSLSPYTTEELVSRHFILDEKPHAIINVVDANNIERNLYLTMQLIELGVPVVLALNMIDELHGNGGSIRVNEMEKELGIPVVPISAMKNEGVDELIEHAIHIAKYQETPVQQDFCEKSDGGGAVHRCLHSLMHLIEDHATDKGVPLRFAASKMVEGDKEILNNLELSQNEKEMVEHIILQMEEERGMDRLSAIADMRYSFILRLCGKTVVKPQESKEYRRSQRIDSVLTGRWTALPIFVAIMSAIIYLSIDVLGAPLQELIENGMGLLSAWCDAAMEKAGVNMALRGMVVDGIFGGVGCVISFVPIIILLFFFLSLLEDSGYMARVAFVTDRLLRHIGLSGRSIVPLLIGFGCSVPAVLAARTLPSERDRRLTIMLTPFMSCSAKIPIYAFFGSSFFPRHGGLVLVAIYLFSIAVGVVVAFVGKVFGHKKEAAPFVLELPNYRTPTLKNLWHLLWDKTKDFLQKAFTVIFIATMIIWVLQTFDIRFQMVENGEGSILAIIAGWLAPLFEPIGLGHWQLVTALFSGFIAKESVVSTLEVLDAMPLLTYAGAVSMLVFTVLYTPCVAAIAAVRKELGRGAALLMIAMQCVIAYICAWVVYMIF